MIIKNMVLFIILLIVTLLYINQLYLKKEGFVSSNCPKTMIKDGSKILLLDEEKAKIPGVNPIVLNSLDEYIEYMEWLKANNINCPVLHLEKVINTQGTELYEIKKNFVDKTGYGTLNEIPKSKCKGNSAIENALYNQNQYPSFDPYNQTQGNPSNSTL